MCTYRFFSRTSLRMRWQQVSNFVQVVPKQLGMNEFVCTESHTGSKFYKTSLALLLTWGIVVVHHCVFFLRRQMAPQETAKFRTACLVNFLPVWGRTASPIMHRFGWCFSEDWMCFTTHRTFRNYVSRWRHKIRKLAVEIFQNVKQSTAELCQIFCIVTIYIVINYARDNILPVLHCPGGEHFRHVGLCFCF